MGLIVDERGITRWVGESTPTWKVSWSWPGAGHLTHYSDQTFESKQKAESFASYMRHGGAEAVSVIEL